MSHRLDALRTIRDRLLAARNVVLTTHVNADGDGMGSEVALAGFLARHGVDVAIVNPTPIPDGFSFLSEGIEAHGVGEPRGKRRLQKAEVIAILDTAERSRLGEVAQELESRSAVVVDHHPPTGPAIGDPAISDETACATGELIYDLITLDHGTPTVAEATGIYVAIVTDTGSFRYSNTTPRAHQVTAHLLDAGVDPVQVYRDIFGQYTPARLTLLRSALETLETDPDLPLSWITVTKRAYAEAGASPEDTEGIVEYARRLKGVEMAIMFRELPGGRTKASLRSNGEVNVSGVARSLGGGGHDKAAGIVLQLPLDEARDATLAEAREALRVELRMGGLSSLAP